MILNQIPYDYTVEVTNNFKGLDLIDRVPEELWTEVCDTVLEAVIKTIPKKTSILGIFQARILEWVAISLSRGSS